MKTDAIEVRPTAGAVGAEVLGVDLANLDDRTVDTLRAAWNEHLVMLFREQQLTDKQLLQFTALFGEPDLAPKSVTQDHYKLDPRVAIVTNLDPNGNVLGGLSNNEAFWHTDYSHVEEPPMGSILHAMEVPAQGGNTGFLNMYKALEQIPSELREKIEGKRIKHDAIYNSAGVLRPGMEHSGDITTAPGVYHPIIRTHPETARQCLYLGRRPNSYIEGLSVEESETLLNRLWEFATQQDRFGWEHIWQVGDVVMWDNRCAMHRRDGFSNESRRLMHRTQIRGTKPE